MSVGGEVATQSGPPPSNRQFHFGVALVLGLAAILRAAHLYAVREAPFVAQLALDSQEYDRWAREILAGDLFGRAPFFQAPLYPYLVALLYRVFAPQPMVVYVVQVLAAIGGCAALMACGRRLAGDTLALVAGAMYAIYLPFLFYDGQLLKESLATSGVCVLLWQLTAVGTGADRLRSWLIAGCTAGLIALLRENMLLVLPFLVPVAWLGEGGARRRWVRVGCFAAGVALVLAPVAARNASLGGGFLPTTSQGGVNFWIGNNPEADGTYRPLVPGKQVPAYESSEARRLAEQASGRSLAAHEVSSYWLRRALRWAGERPGAFLRLQGSKLLLYFSRYEWPDAVDYYWMKSLSPPLRLPGLEFGAVSALAALGVFWALRERRRWSAVLLFELGWCATTVAFFLFARYRLPAVPGLLLLGALPVARAIEAGRGGRRRVALALGGVVLVLFAAPHVRPFPPRLDLVEFNLGRLAEERNAPGEARVHYERALEADPTGFSPTLNLGNLDARSGDYPAARVRFESAVSLEPGSDDAHANLGAAHLALGDLEAARDEFDTALRLNPENRFALHNRELLRKRERSAANTAP